MCNDIEEKIKTFIEGKGFKLGVFSCCRHTCGINKEAGVLVRPDYTYNDGGRTIKVTPTRVIDYTVSCPYNYNDWRERKSKTYKTQEEMIEILEDWCKEKSGCW